MNDKVERFVRKGIAAQAAADEMTGGFDDQLVRPLANGNCPDCGYRGFILGPRGGASMNIECGNLQCRARFNVACGPLSYVIVWAQRIPRERDGGGKWDTR